MTAVKNTIRKPEVAFWIAIIVPLFGVAVSWGVFSNRIDNLEKAVDTLESNSAYQVTTTQEVQIRLAEIQKDIAYIKQRLE